MSNEKAKAKIQTRNPGEEIPAKQMPPQEPEKTPEQVAAETEAQARPGNTLVITPEIQAVIDEQVKAQIKKAERRALMEAKNKSPYPPQEEIDAKTITRAKMSSDGWVCPAPPEMTKEQQIALMRVM